MERLFGCCHAKRSLLQAPGKYYLASPCGYKSFAVALQVSSPFGKRCSSLHDKRVAGPSSSWLTHTETKGNSLPTEINVESRYQQRLYSLLYSTPFGNQFSIHSDNWEVLFNLVCNLTDTDKRCGSISPVHKVDMAIKMRGRSDWGYIFKPQHVIHGELCMVLQKRSFLAAGAEATEISLKSYNPSSPGHIIVWELAFGPNGAEWGHPSVRPVGLYFNIKEEDVITCTPQQAKRYRWKPNTKKKPSMDELTQGIDCVERFEMVRPADSAAFDLATRILRCHREELRVEAFPALDPIKHGQARENVQQEKLELRNLINCHIAHWKRWAWPINAGRENFDEDTPVPSVDAVYEPSDLFTDCRNSALIWETFLAADFNVQEAPRNYHWRVSSGHVAAYGALLFCVGLTLLCVVWLHEC